jgi:hypothetical protein
VDGELFVTALEGDAGQAMPTSASPAPVGAGGCPDIPDLFSTTCTASLCHDASNKAQGLDLASPHVAARLVGVSATEGRGLLIDPATPSNSILYLKLTDSPPFGARMPLAQTPLAASTTACVLAWITNGEPDSPSPDAGADAPSSPSPSSSSSSSSSPDAATPVDSSSGGGGSVCATSVDSYGLTRCACFPGSVETTNTVATCSGYDCCVRYASDSGLAEGFGNPLLSSGLCACYSSADITAMLGASATCKSFAGGSSDRTIVQSCP